MPETPSAFRLKSLHSEFGVPDVDIRPYVDLVRGRGVEELDVCLDLDPKVRRNVLTVFLTEKWWRHVEKSESDSPDTFGLPESDFRSLETRIPDALFPEVFRHLTETTHSHLLECSGLCDFDSDPIVKELKRTRFLDSNGNARAPYPGRFNAGIENANMMAWESIHQLPYIHRRDCDTAPPLSPEQYQEIASRNISFLRHLAAAHLQIFSAAHSSARHHGGVRAIQHFHAFSSDFLAMTGESHALRMELHPSIVDYINQFREDFEVTIATGCPALIAKASNGKDVVTAMYEWVQRIASRTFFPHIEKLLARTDLSDISGTAVMQQVFVNIVQNAKQ